MYPLVGYGFYLMKTDPVYTQKTEHKALSHNHQKFGLSAFLLKNRSTESKNLRKNNHGKSNLSMPEYSRLRPGSGNSL